MHCIDRRVFVHWAHVNFYGSNNPRSAFKSTRNYLFHFHCKQPWFWLFCEKSQNNFSQSTLDHKCCLLSLMCIQHRRFLYYCSCTTKTSKNEWNNLSIFPTLDYKNSQETDHSTVLTHWWSSHQVALHTHTVILNHVELLGTATSCCQRSLPFMLPQVVRSHWKCIISDHFIAASHCQCDCGKSAQYNSDCLL